jgi:YVTN family beta-propeller protein
MLVFSLSGTNELMLLDLRKLKTRLEKLEAGKDEFVSSKDDIVNHIEYLTGLRTRIKLAGTGVRDIQVVGEKVYAAEYFSGTVSVVDTKKETVLTQYKLGTQPDATPERLGETIWYDASFCYQQWESCASCHPDARADALNWDNLNDGLGNPKNTKSMLFSHRTPPVMITGARDSAELAVRKGMLFIQFNVLDELRLCAIDEYLKSLMPTDSPYLKEDGTYTEAALRGEKLFEEVGCATCHPAPLYTDLKFHKSPYLGKDGTWENREFITPTLVEVWRSAPYSYCGMITDMKQLVKDFANRALTDEEAADLAAFVLSIGTVNENYGVEQVLSKKGDTTLYSKIVAGATIETITVRKQIPSASKVADPVITVKLCDKTGKVVSEKSFTPGAMAYNTATKLECGIAVPADFAEGGYLVVTIADSQGKALASDYTLVCGASK